MGMTMAIMPTIGPFQLPPETRGTGGTASRPGRVGAHPAFMWGRPSDPSEPPKPA